MKAQKSYKTKIKIEKFYRNIITYLLVEYCEAVKINKKMLEVSVGSGQ